MYNLLDIHIVGIIDSYGAVHSAVIDISELSEKTHEAVFPGNYFKRWRWDYNNGLVPSILSSDFDLEEWDKIRSHLTDIYTIKWWENGYHDIDDIKNRFE